VSGGDQPAPRPFRAIAFSGSLRRGSSNTGLVHLARRLASSTDLAGRLQVEVAGWLRDLPFYDPDLEADLPPVAARWRAAVTEADALVIGMPEYNFGPTGFAKNAIDWLTRPLGAHALRGKVIAMLTSGGKGGGTRVQAAVGPILTLLGNTVVDEPPVTIALGAERIAADGTADPAVEALVLDKLRHVLAVLEA